MSLQPGLQKERHQGQLNPYMALRGHCSDIFATQNWRLKYDRFIPKLELEWGKVVLLSLPWYR